MSIEHGSTHDRPGPDIDPEDVSTNPSGNRAFKDVLAKRATRRAVLGGGTLAAAAGFLMATDPLTALRQTAEAAPASAESETGHRRRGRLLGFTPVPTGTADTVVVPEGYVAEAFIPWGTPLRANGPAWKKDASNTAAEQAQQVGFNHDGMHYFPIGDDRRGSEHGLLVVNHEYTDAAMIYTDGGAELTQEKVDKALNAHGVSVVEIKKRNGRWVKVDSRRNRRVTGKTPVTFSGPVPAGHPALKSNNKPMGTLNNCSNGYTPWGTYLACEENWNSYFGTTDATWKPAAEQARYGVNAAGFGYGWHTVDPRFDIAENPNEINRFGWVVEIDPADPGSTPVKRTALGRVKHEGATVTESRGRIVVYTGDDQDGEYIYKFVGSAPWRQLRHLRKDPLDHGTLYVARFDDDGSGEWLPLVHGRGALTTANGWKDQADVLLRTRQAADAVGATKMDRPEWVAVNPRNQDVYCTLTNGTSGQAPWDPKSPNPRDPNPYGHIIHWKEKGGDNTALTFTWDIFVLSGDPKYDEHVKLDETNMHGSPDGLGFDADGRLWIETDISNSSQNLASKGYDRIGNNQMLAADPTTGEIRRFLVGPRGCEITGWTITPDQRTLFVNIQHPGEETKAWGTPTAQNPRAVSNWPDFDPQGRPRPATLVIRKRDGGIIGT